MNNMWIDFEEWTALKEWYAMFDTLDFIKNYDPEEDSYYYVNLSNSDDSIHTLGMKSRKTGKIYLTKEYVVDLTQPIENTDFHFVRNSTSFDL